MRASLEQLSGVNPDMDGAGAALWSAVAQEMRVARDLVEELAGVLVADEHFVLDYLDQFQAFDLIVQHMDEAAALLDRVVAGESVEDAVARVRLSSVQERLRAALV
jgi:hypothetical protein